MCIKFLDDEGNILKEEVIYDLEENFMSRIVAKEIIGYTEVK